MVGQIVVLEPGHNPARKQFQRIIGNFWQPRLY